MNALSGDSSDLTASEAEIYGVLTTSSSTEGAPCSAKAAAQTARSASVSDQVFSGGSLHSATKWLIDSGATSHIVASQNSEQYQITREYSGSVDLRAANGGLIAVSKVVDLAVLFTCRWFQLALSRRRRIVVSGRELS